mmetsp:Transcript_23322/g.42175  ORF Transcript_23322/g.42175 Transcript_23322/m.42175 type:complete len:88 (-) Transcript_23322:101-364(-)
MAFATYHATATAAGSFDNSKPCKVREEYAENNLEDEFKSDDKHMARPPSEPNDGIEAGHRNAHKELQHAPLPERVSPVLLLAVPKLS